eukprot:767701-Hanusia_phi.AAC.12
MGGGGRGGEVALSDILEVLDERDLRSQQLVALEQLFHLLRARAKVLSCIKTIGEFGKETEHIPRVKGIAAQKQSHRLVVLRPATSSTPPPCRTHST